MIGVRRLAWEQDAEVLRLARGGRLAQATDKDYRAAVHDAETALGAR